MGRGSALREYSLLLRPALILTTVYSHSRSRMVAHYAHGGELDVS